MAVPFDLPRSRSQIRALQSERKKLAFDRAKLSPWYRDRLRGVKREWLDEPEEWSKIPILDKDTLRQWSHDEFMRQINVASPEEISEYWRSGGTTGKPVFYPRTFEDVTYGLLSWGRSFPCIGIGPGDLCHISFPIGIHPAGQIWARSAHSFGVGMSWVGAGNAVPSRAQLELILTLKPTVLIAMPGFALHLANIADAEGIDLAAATVRKVVCSAEPLSLAKREKLERMWGAEVYDVFGMSEAGLMGAESDAHDGIHIWSDLFFCEIVDPGTGQPIPHGEIGTFCVTPLYTGHATPFLRWNSGDMASLIERGTSESVYAELFPMIRHAHRTAGFFKIRGVNVNHAEFEDFMFARPEISDFQGVLSSDPGGLDVLKLRIEVRRGGDAETIVRVLREDVKLTFELGVEVETLVAGSLARAFENAIKAPRFVDERN